MSPANSKRLTSPKNDDCGDNDDHGDNNNDVNNVDDDNDDNVEGDFSDGIDGVEGDCFSDDVKGDFDDDITRLCLADEYVVVRHRIHHRERGTVVPLVLVFGG